MDTFRTLTRVLPVAGPDGSRIQEVAGRSTGLTSHSLAVIAHPAGTASADHHHTIADEVYLVQAGHGRIRVDDVTQRVGPGDVIIIRQGQSHQLWSEGPGDLVLVVTCAPAYTTEDVVWNQD